MSHFEHKHINVVLLHEPIWICIRLSTFPLATCIVFLLLFPHEKLDNFTQLHAFVFHAVCRAFVHCSPKNEKHFIQNDEPIAFTRANVRPQA